MVIMHLIKELTENYEEHEEMLELVRFFIVPIVNPDGYQYTHDTDRLWRKNLRGYEEGVEEGCFGVDCNRNYDHKWEEGETEDVRKRRHLPPESSFHSSSLLSRSAPSSTLELQPSPKSRRRIFVTSSKEMLQQSSSTSAPTLTEDT